MCGYFRFAAAILLCLTLLSGVMSGASLADDYTRALTLAQRTERMIFRDNVTPNWLPDQKRFWYRVAISENTQEFVLVDAETGSIQRAATRDKLGLPENTRLLTSAQGPVRRQWTTHTGNESSLQMTNAMAEAVDVFWVDSDGARKPYGRIEPGRTQDFHTFEGHVWLVAKSSGETLGVFEATAKTLEIIIDGQPEPRTTPPIRNNSRGGGKTFEARNVIRLADNNVQLVDTNGNITMLTSNGTTSAGFRGPVVWSPDARHGVVFFVRDVPRRQVTIVQSSPPGQIQPKLIKFDYLKPGDSLPQIQPVLVSVGEKIARIIPDDLFSNAFTPDGVLDIRWSPGSGEFYFDFNQRGHQRYCIMAVNATNGAVRRVVEETSRTFVDYTKKTWREWLDESGELLWMSERDGWAHLWLYDVAQGKVKCQVTRGNWVVRNVIKVDKSKRQVWFMASGLRPDENPYHRHLCRVNFDGSGFVQLTHGDGDQTVEFSPDGRWFIARWSRVDQPVVTELHRSEDGGIVCELERADIARLLKAGWSLPERFIAKGRDGRTDIYGVIIRPSQFDPLKKYPVVEEVYAGPQDSFAPLSFGRLLRQHALAELGFIIVQVDGMGTDNRGKAFHEVCWKNLKEAGFPDRIAWLKAAARTRPWMDMKRIGIYGGSAGGQNAMRALLDYGDFYQAALADCGCHDNRMDKIWWNEQWLGWPVDDAYIRSSNVEDAAKLRGKLMLMVGELDQNVDPASTMQVANALEKAGKPFELVVVTGIGHGAAETPYGSRRRMDFFVRTLLGQEPPEE